MGIISSILDIAASLLGITRKRNEDANSPEMKANAAAAEKQQQAEQATKTVESGDVDKFREGIS